MRTAVVLICLTASAALADLPPGFTRTQLAGNETVYPTSLAVLPDLRVLVGGYAGLVSLVQQGQPTLELLQLDDCFAGDDHGLLGLTVDPAFASNGYFYIFYTANGPYDR